MTTLSYRFACRRRAAADWASLNEVLLKGEIGLETDTGQFKFGDGVTAWATLPYFSSGGGGGGAGSIGCSFDGGVNGVGTRQVLAAGTVCDVLVPFDCTIDAVTLLADQSGSLVVSVWADAYGSYPPTAGDNIAGSTPPTISAATKSRDATLTGWTTAIVAGTTLRFTIVSVSGITRAALTLEITKT